MEQSLTNCWHGLTPKCPNVAKECMQSLIPSTNGTKKDITGANEDEANKLCRSCDKFSQMKED